MTEPGPATPDRPGADVPDGAAPVPEATLPDGAAPVPDETPRPALEAVPLIDEREPGPGRLAAAGASDEGSQRATPTAATAYPWPDTTSEPAPSGTSPSAAADPEIGAHPTVPLARAALASQAQAQTQPSMPVPGQGPAPYAAQPPSVQTGGWGWQASGAPVPPPAPPRRGVGTGVAVVIGVVCLLAGLVGGLALAPFLAFGTESGSASQPEIAEVPDTLPAAGNGVIPTDVAEIAALALPSTVAIEVVLPDGTGSSGSGFVLREDGYLLTNAHVVSYASQEGSSIYVIFADGEQFPAQIVGTTSDYDLAVLHVDRDDLTPLVLGDSDALRVGQGVVAVGAPLGLQGTVTAGIISALDRPVSGGEDVTDISYMNAIQTDAAINPGNSGGPLLDANGEVIGVNSAIAQATGIATGSIGLGFAIPSNQARRTAEELIANGVATYPVIGVLLDSSYLGVGVMVAQDTIGDTPPLTPGGAAEAAGIEPGDIIVAIDGRPVTAPEELIVAIRAHAPGDVVTLTVREPGGDRDVDVRLGEARSE